MSSDDRQAGMETVAAAFRSESGKVIAALVRVIGDIDLAEDAVQDALAIALQRWPSDGVPSRPGAWLMTTARNKALDHLRRERSLAATREALLQLTTVNENGGPEEPEPDIPDDRLSLLFMCCHPALTPEVRVALTLRLIGGLSTEEIARAFLVQDSTMAQRLVRGKKKIRGAGIPFRVPGKELLPARLDSVMAVIYLIFNEGYASSGGPQLIREPLCDEAIRLARILHELLPDEAESTGLLALLLLLDSRRVTRSGPDGGLVLLSDQDRSWWDQEKIAEGCRLVEEALSGHRPGRYQLEAAIAAVHAQAASMAETDWQEIAALYRELQRLAPSPIVILNRAVAVAEAESTAAGLALVDSVAEQLDAYYLLHATRAELLRRQGFIAEAGEAYDRAIALAVNPVERAFLVGRRGELAASGGR